MDFLSAFAFTYHLNQLRDLENRRYHKELGLSHTALKRDRGGPDHRLRRRV
jgi:hypothetical protein